MKYVTYLMADLTSQNSGFFEIFILNLKNEIPRIAYNCAKNIDNILENFDVPAEKYGPLLLQQVVDLLMSPEISKALPEHKHILKNIVCKLSEVLDEGDFLEMVKPLFGHLELSNEFADEISVDEACSLIRLYEPPRLSESQSKIKRMSKHGQSSFMTNFRKKSIKENMKMESKAPKREPKDQRLLRPIQLYSKIQKMFAVCGTIENLFQRPVLKYPEYCQNALADFEKKFETQCNIKLCFFTDPKDSFKLQKCSHYSVVKLSNELLQRSPSLLEKNDSNTIAMLHNQTVLINAAQELINILEVEKLEKQSSTWEMVMPPPPDKKSIRQFRPKGQCLATLFSNRGRLKVLARGKNNMFFSGSDQGEVRIFDFSMFFKPNESLLRSKIDMNVVVNRIQNPRRNSFSTCPDT